MGTLPQAEGPGTGKIRVSVWWEPLQDKEIPSHNLVHCTRHFCDVQHWSDAQEVAQALRLLFKVHTEVGRGK